MKKLLFTLMVLGIFGIFAASAFGQSTPHADRRQKNQKHRIKKGVKSGEITKREARSVHKSEKEARQFEAKAKSDGKVTWKERARLQHKENKASRKIFRTKHNNRDRN